VDRKKNQCKQRARVQGLMPGRNGWCWIKKKIHWIWMFGREMLPNFQRQCRF